MTEYPGFEPSPEVVELRDQFESARGAIETGEPTADLDTFLQIGVNYWRTTWFELSGAAIMGPTLDRAHNATEAFLKAKEWGDAQRVRFCTNYGYERHLEISLERKSDMDSVQISEIMDRANRARTTWFNLAAMLQTPPSTDRLGTASEKLSSDVV